MLTKESRELDFPSLAGLTYLNTAAEGISPPVVQEAFSAYSRDRLSGFDGRKKHEEQRIALKERAGKFLGLSAGEVSVCSCSSEAYNLACLALDAVEGDEVILNDLDYPAGFTPWSQRYCRATVKLWRSRAGALRVEDLIPLLGPRTRLLQTSLVSYYNGFRLPTHPVVDAVRKHSPALVAVDVTQALGRLSLDLEDVDLIISSTHKWVLGSHGGGLVGVPARRSAEWTVPAGGWFNLREPFAPDRFERKPEHLPGAASFTVGMPNYAAVYAVGAALRYLDSVGVAAIEAYAGALVAECLAELRRLPVHLITPVAEEFRSGILAFQHPESARLSQKLHDGGVHVMHTDGRIRVSIHGYNTAEDVDTFLRVLKAALAS